MKKKTCLINLIAICKELTGLVDEKRAGDDVYLERRAFHNVSHNVLKDKLMKYGLDKSTVETG